MMRDVQDRLAVRVFREDTVEWRNHEELACGNCLRCDQAETLPVTNNTLCVTSICPHRKG